MAYRTAVLGPTPNVKNLGVQAYAQSVGVTAGQILYLCVQPSQTFRIAFYKQGVNEALSPVSGASPLVQDMRFVSRNGSVFTSWGIVSPQKADLDWNWPRIGFGIPAAWGSGVYFAIVYPVDPTTGVATDQLGEAVQAGDPQGKLKPHPDFSTNPILAWDHGMALFVVRPTAPTSGVKIAYVLAVTTYQAYNFTDRCFYYTNAIGRVTLRRPGCGVGNVVMDDEKDTTFDPTSRRNTYAHWDAYFIRWLQINNIACDFYTNLDMDHYTDAQPHPLMSGAAPLYPMMLAVGHDEYWGRAIRTAIETYQQADGNIAIFSGNTCYRPLGFGAPSTTASRYDAPSVPVPSDQKSILTKLDDTWPDELNESSTTGVTFKKGAGSWSKQRRNAGYTIAAPVIGDITIIGAAQCLVGYECDATFANPPSGTPANYVVTGHADLTDPTQWDTQMPGKAEMGWFKRNLQAPANKSILFNAATTDWARFLPLGPTTDPDKLAVDRMTKSVITNLTS
jgi:N,N-dimethylformamidase beta subunit-like, C-terminal